ncbi:ATP-binding protein [Streptomyces sp. NPDC001843]|uniref:ATP-binding protein n=1 Tax=Streptomyces sp. NPDC001843 TaxID=3364617 RepID=UPI003688464D
MRAGRKATAMPPPSLPQPLHRLPGAEHLDNQSADGRPHRPSAAAPPLRPPGGEHTGRLPGPEGPDRLASGAEPPQRTHAFALPSTPASVARARASVHEALASWGIDGDAADSAVLITSELVTNALTHSAGERIVCRLRLTPERLRIEVEDDNRGPSRPAPRQPGPEDQSGRGLLLVEALSTDWGVTGALHLYGRVVWAELTTTVHGAGPATPPLAP